MNIVADIILGILVVALAIRVFVGFDMGISVKPSEYTIWTVLLLVVLWILGAFKFVFGQK